MGLVGGFCFQKFVFEKLQISDFDGIDKTIPGLTDVSSYPDLIAVLIARGFSDEEIVGVLGGNLLRVMEAAENVAISLKSEVPGQAVMSDIVNNSCRTIY